MRLQNSKKFGNQRKILIGVVEPYNDVVIHILNNHRLGGSVVLAWDEWMWVASELPWSPQSSSSENVLHKARFLIGLHESTSGPYAGNAAQDFVDTMKALVEIVVKL
jgi:hypothetical protein